MRAAVSWAVGIASQRSEHTFAGARFFLIRNLPGPTGGKRIYAAAASSNASSAAILVLWALLGR